MQRYLFILLLIFEGVFAQVQFEAKPSRTSLGLNETLRVDFTMNVDGDNFVKPTFEGFKIIAGPSQSVSQSWINGKSTFEKSYTYYLRPNHKGVITIKQAEIEYGGQVYKTSPFKITVTSEVQRQRDPDDPDSSPINADQNIYLVAEVSKANPYINEPITVVYRLYFSYSIGIDNWKELDKPTYNDFWSHNIEIKELVPEEGTFKGEKYRFVVLKKAVLYPQKAAQLKIEPLTLDIDTQLPTNRADIFGRVIMRKDSKRVTSGSKIINVKPLPDNKKILGYAGAVGTFDFKVTPSKNVLKSGESLQLTVSVSGKGNLKLFNIPKPEVPNALEMYEPVHKENITVPLSGMTGTISDNYTIIPQYKGEYKIKPLLFTYFDIHSNSYKTITSNEVSLKVLDGPMGAATALADTINKITKQYLSPTSQFKFIELKTKLKPIKQADFLGSTLYYILLILPFLFLPLIVFFRKKQEALANDIIGNKLKMNNRLAKKYLSEAKKQIKDKDPFYVALEKALHNFLKAKLKIETSEMTKENIKVLLLQNKATPQTVDDFISLVESCEMARYAASSETAINLDFEKAVSTITELEKQLV